MRANTLHLIVSIVPGKIALLRENEDERNDLHVPKTTFYGPNPPIENVLTLLKDTFDVVFTAEEAMPHLEYLGQNDYGYQQLMRFNQPLKPWLVRQLTTEHPRRTGSKAEYEENVGAIVEKLMVLDNFKQVTEAKFEKMKEDGKFGFLLRTLFKDIAQEKAKAGTIQTLLPVPGSRVSQAEELFERLRTRISNAA